MVAASFFEEREKDTADSVIGCQKNIKEADGSSGKNNQQNYSRKSVFNNGHGESDDRIV